MDMRKKPYSEEAHKTFISEIKGCFANVIQKHLAVFGDPCNDIPLDSNTSEANNARYNYCAQKLDNLQVRVTDPQKQIQYLFLDDVDYLPVCCFSEILENLKPILLSRYFCVIIACRTPAFNTLQSHRDFNIGRAFDDAKIIRLHPLPVHKILKARMRIIADGNQSARKVLTSTHPSGIVLRFFSVLEYIISQLEKDDDIEVFKYAFTPKQHSFMRMMSNGNIRHVLKMAQEYLNYMSNHRKEIKKLQGGYWIGRPAVIEHFTNSQIDSKIRIHNIHLKKTFQYTSASEQKRRKIAPQRVGNSIYVLLLETYKHFQYPNRLDAQYMEKLDQEYGLTDRDFKDGTADLIDLELIRERLLSSRPPIGTKTLPNDYDLTEKGECYLNYLIHWDKYIERFGISEHHKTFKTQETMTAVSEALLQFLVNIIALKRKINQGLPDADFKVAKQPFRDQFCKLNRALFRHLDPTDKLTIPKLLDADITYYLSSWLQVIETYKLDEQTNYLFLHENVLAAAAERNLPIETRDIYDMPAFQRFLTTFVREPEYEKQGQ